jgi:hypothetical protein
MMDTFLADIAKDYHKISFIGKRIGQNRLSTATMRSLPRRESHAVTGGPITPKKQKTGRIKTARMTQQ